MQSYNLNGRRINTLGENELVLSCEIITFPSGFYIYFAPHLPRNMPAARRVLLSKGTSRLYESLPHPRAALVLREQSDFAMLEALNPLEFALFRYFSASTRTTGATMQSLSPLELFVYPMD